MGPLCIYISAKDSAPFPNQPTKWHSSTCRGASVELHLSMGKPRTVNNCEVPRCKAYPGFVDCQRPTRVYQLHNFCVYYNFFHFYQAVQGDTFWKQASMFISLLKVKIVYSGLIPGVNNVSFGIRGTSKLAGCWRRSYIVTYMHGCIDNSLN